MTERPENPALFPEWESENPQWNWEVRQRAHQAMHAVYEELHQVLRYRFDKDGRFIEPTGVSDGGDVTGVMLTANNEVLSRLDRAVRGARDEFHGIFDDIDRYKRRIYGPAYRPIRSDLHTGELRAFPEGE
ncbi:hypothetical protein [Streptosporangium sp. NBC_01469]|uniref:hypothetical protein n=1 Tax=Streptosporangium sp. NBC_01469 TaxID=2903898 RepID=UPI002E2D8AC2|nr:hypothetical protein [Streptosporangium sp. NBC_01469]